MIAGLAVAWEGEGGGGILVVGGFAFITTSSRWSSVVTARSPAPRLIASGPASKSPLGTADQPATGPISGDPPPPSLSGTPAQVLDHNFNSVCR
jgi:hypothetical protein